MVSYLEIKEIIEKFSKKYKVEPEIKIKNDCLDIEFKLSKKISFNLITKLCEILGKMDVHGYTKELFLKGDSYELIFSEFFYDSIKMKKRKNFDFSPKEIEALEVIFDFCKVDLNLDLNQDSLEERLLGKGCKLYKANGLSWDTLAGYDDIKQEIKQSIIFPLKNQELYEKITKSTRKNPESILPEAILFEGPSGTGKTTMAKIISKETNKQLVYIPIESIMSMWYGQSERNLSEIFDLCNRLENPIIFIDEIDSLVTSREKEMHEATRRILGVLLRRIEGIEPNKSLVVAATNRKDDLDRALLSRFNLIINFRLPTTEERAKIFQYYAKHLKEDQLKSLAEKTEKLTGRDIKKICEHTERKWTSKLIESNKEFQLPPLEEYLESLKLLKFTA